MKLDKDNSEINYMVLRTRTSYEHHYCPCHTGLSSPKNDIISADISYKMFDHKYAAFEYGWRLINHKWICKDCMDKLCKGQLYEI